MFDRGIVVVRVPISISGWMREGWYAFGSISECFVLQKLEELVEPLGSRNKADLW